jgi:hypothetical protein
VTIVGLVFLALPFPHPRSQLVFLPMVAALVVAVWLLVALDAASYLSALSSFHYLESFGHRCIASEQPPLGLGNDVPGVHQATFVNDSSLGTRFNYL